MKNQKHNITGLRKMFNGVSVQYDFLNRLLTLGFDQKYRTFAADLCLKNSDGCILDLCSGTGDLAEKILKRANKPARIILVDFSENMLLKARNKLSTLNSGDNIFLIHANADSLPFKDNYFDAIGIAYGFRNLLYKRKQKMQYLKEIFRVLKSGGKFVFLETSQPENRCIKRLFHFYMTFIVPVIGGTLFRNKGAYHYLGKSAKEFYCPKEIEVLLEKTGFKTISWYRFLKGIIRIGVASP